MQLHHRLFILSLLIIIILLASFTVTGPATAGIVWLWAGLSAWYALEKPLWPKGKLPLLMLIFLLWITTSIWWSQFPYSSWNTVLIFSALPISFIAWQLTPNPDEVWVKLKTAFVAGTWIVSLMGIYQAAFLGLPRAFGPVTDPNVYACLLNLIWFPLLSAFFKASTNPTENSNFTRIILGISLLLVSLAFFAASSRGATLSWLLLMPLAFFAFKDLYGFRQNAVIALSIVLLSYLVITTITQINLTDRTSLQFLENDASVSVRLVIWHSTIDMFLTHPWIGTGLGTWGDFYPAYRQALDNSTAGYYAHNDYLQIAQEGGIVTVALFISIFFFLASLTFNTISSAKRQSIKIENIGLMLGVMAAYMHAAVNFIFYLIYINIIVGIYAARVWQSNNASQYTTFGLTKAVSTPLQRTLLIFALAIPTCQIALHEASEILLNGTNRSLSVLRKKFPKLTPYEIALFIAAIRPDEYIAQRYIADSAAKALDEINPKNTPLQREILLETIAKYDELRKRTANSPEIAATEANLILAHNQLVPNSTHWARSLANSALASNPRHVESIIALANSYFMENDIAHGYEVLSNGISTMIFLKDRLILQAEVLKHQTPQIEILNGIEEQLKNIKFACKIGQCVNNQVNEINQETQLRKFAASIFPTSNPVVNNSLNSLINSRTK
jgi:O-antigen ligase